MNTCATDIAKNIQQNCSKPLVDGYTGRAVLIPWKLAPTIAQDATNPRLINTITLSSGQKVIGVDNVMPDPFGGSNKASNSEKGFINYTKTMSVRIPMRGAAVSKDVIEPLMTSEQGFIGIFEKNDKGAGTFEVIGFQRPLKANADGLSQSETENGGAYIVTLSTTEPWCEAEFMPSTGTYASALAAFNALWANTVEDTSSNG